MGSTERDCLPMIRFWIFEHACKFKMIKVIHEMLQAQQPSLNLKCIECEENNKSRFPSCINPNYMVNIFFCGLLETMTSLLQKPLTTEALVKVDIQLLEQGAEILETLYSQRKFLKFQSFNKMHSALKLLSLILRVVRNEKKEEIREHLDELFPHFNQKRLESQKEKFGLNDNIAKNLQLKEREARIFVLQLMLAETKRDIYMQTRLIPEVEQFLQAAKEILPLVIERAIMPYMPHTSIEKILQGNSEIIATHKDPAIQILMEFLQPDLNEDNLITVLRVLDPNTCADVKNAFNGPTDPVIPVTKFNSLPDQCMNNNNTSVPQEPKGVYDHANKMKCASASDNNNAPVSLTRNTNVETSSKLEKKESPLKRKTSCPNSDSVSSETGGDNETSVIARQQKKKCSDSQQPIDLISAHHKKLRLNSSSDNSELNTSELANNPKGETSSNGKRCSEGAGTAKDKHSSSASSSLPDHLENTPPTRKLTKSTHHLMPPSKEVGHSGNSEFVPDSRDSSGCSSPTLVLPDIGQHHKEHVSPCIVNLFFKSELVQKNKVYTIFC